MDGTHQVSKTGKTVTKGWKDENERHHMEGEVNKCEGKHWEDERQ